MHIAAMVVALPVVVLALWASGGAHSYMRPVLLLAPIHWGFFVTRRRVLAALCVGLMLTFWSPLLYQTGVGLLSSTATLLNVNVVRAASLVRTVTLRPWDRAFFTFSFVVSGPCAHGIFPFGIQVIPPNTSSGLRMYRRFDICGGTNPSLTAMRSTL